MFGIRVFYDITIHMQHQGACGQYCQMPCQGPLAELLRLHATIVAFPGRVRPSSPLKQNPIGLLLLARLMPGAARNVLPAPRALVASHRCAMGIDSAGICSTALLACTQSFPC